MRKIRGIFGPSLFSGALIEFEENSRISKISGILRTMISSALGEGTEMAETNLQGRKIMALILHFLEYVETKFSIRKNLPHVIVRPGSLLHAFSFITL